MKRISLLTLIFAVLSFTFIILLVFLRSPFPPFPLVSWQDVFDLLTPLILIPLYWLIFHYAGRDAPRLAESLAFTVLAAVWVEGQGIHLAANSINNLLGEAAASLLNEYGGGLELLTYFYDERLGHILWHAGMYGLAALLIYREWRGPVGESTTWWLAIPAGIIYGLTLFMISVEGQTPWMGLPFTLLGSLLGLTWGRKVLGGQPVLAFFTLSCLVALLFLTGWGLYWGGFPEFGEVGLI